MGTGHSILAKPGGRFMKDPEFFSLKYEIYLTFEIFFLVCRLVLRLRFDLRFVCLPMLQINCALVQVQRDKNP